MKSESRIILRYIFICVCAFLFLLFYLWQSIESTRIRLECRNLIKLQKALVDENDVYKYEIEKIKNSGMSGAYAVERGYRKALPSEIGVIVLSGK